MTAGGLALIELKTAHTLVQGTKMGSAEAEHMTADTHSFNFHSGGLHSFVLQR